MRPGLCRRCRHSSDVYSLRGFSAREVELNKRGSELHGRRRRGSAGYKQIRVQMRGGV